MTHRLQGKPRTMAARSPLERFWIPCLARADGPRLSRRHTHERATVYDRSARAAARYRLRDPDVHRHARNLQLVLGVQDPGRDQAALGDRRRRRPRARDLVLLGIVTIFLVPSDIGKMFKADGQEAPFSGWTGLWHFLPIVGSIIWFVKVQGALNRYWEGKAGTAPAPSSLPPRREAKRNGPGHAGPFTSPTPVVHRLSAHAPAARRETPFGAQTSTEGDGWRTSHEGGRSSGSWRCWRSQRRPSPRPGWRQRRSL